ncbi:hypothetical protein M378DRAFT_165122, partial [Amanita muscaria Koide BX008]
MVQAEILNRNRDRILTVPILSLSKGLQCNQEEHKSLRQALLLGVGSGVALRMPMSI